MADQRRPSLPQRPKGETPAERSVRFDATQARLKEEAAARRAASQDAAAKDKSS